MFESIKSVLSSWNTANNQRQKLQHSYIAVVIVVVFGSGIVSLINGEAGHNLVKVALFAIAVFFANAVVCNLLDASLLSKLSRKTRRK